MKPGFGLFAPALLMIVILGTASVRPIADGSFALSLTMVGVAAFCFGLWCGRLSAHYRLTARNRD